MVIRDMLMTYRTLCNAYLPRDAYSACDTDAWFELRDRWSAMPIVAECLISTICPSYLHAITTHVEVKAPVARQVMRGAIKVGSLMSEQLPTRSVA